MNDELENALAWFKAAPASWASSAKKNIEAGAEWIWEVLQGDFHEDQSTAQVVTGTIISMIPFVDQICDVRDVCACSGKIKKDPNNVWEWVGLVMTLIGLIPVLGSVFKGCGKVMFAAMRRARPNVIEKFLDAAIIAFNKLLTRPIVRKAFNGMRIDNIYKEAAKAVRKVAANVNKSTLMKALDEIIEAANGLLDIVRARGSKALGEKALGLMKDLANLRKLADSKMAAAFKPVKDMLEQLARRLDLESDMAHRAALNVANPHTFKKVTDKTEEALIKKHKPKWAEIRPDLPHRPLVDAETPLNKNWTRTDLPWPHPLANAHKTFSTLDQIIIPPGTKLYRIVDPTSKDNSICWMSEAEFFSLKTKADWRSKFAVWANWNGNGEFVTYVVPPGKPLHVWEGVTASQRIGTDVVLVGGARQIVIDPAHMLKSQMGPRQPTKWGYNDLGVTNKLVGIPVLKNSWFTPPKTK